MKNRNEAIRHLQKNGEYRFEGLGREEIEGLLEECQVSEDSQILKFLQKKGYGKETTLPRDRARLVSALVRKGFSYDAVYRVMGECEQYL